MTNLFDGLVIVVPAAYHDMLLFAESQCHYTQPLSKHSEAGQDKRCSTVAGTLFDGLQLRVHGEFLQGYLCKTLYSMCWSTVQLLVQLWLGCWY